MSVVFPYEDDPRNNTGPVEYWTKGGSHSRHGSVGSSNGRSVEFNREFNPAEQDGERRTVASRSKFLSTDHFLSSFGTNRRERRGGGGGGADPAGCFPMGTSEVAAKNEGRKASII